jgi:peroxiredoxin
MIESGQKAPDFSLGRPNGEPALLVFFETDCPTCRLTVPFLNILAKESVHVIGISQDSESLTRNFIEEMSITFPVTVDRDLKISRAYDPVAVPTLVLLDGAGTVLKTQVGFDKEGLNSIAAELGQPPVAGAYDGAPARKPGCTSRHREPSGAEETAQTLALHRARGSRANRTILADEQDLYEYCRETFGDVLPVIPPTVERVERMLAATPREPEEVIGQIPPCYGEATVEKIAANAVMAGCAPEMMRVLIPLVRALCDERLNIHGVQATTHFAAPLVVVNGPARNELGFACRQNVFSNVRRANSTLGRAMQLILLNVGGGRPDGIDMSALGNPGKFSYCIAENEEESPWEPLHVELGFRPEQSTVTVFAAEPPRGVAEHKARSARGLLKTITYTLATVFTYRACLGYEAMVILSPEHGKTIHQDGWSKQDVRQFLFENTGVPVRAYEGEEGEGTQFVAHYKEVMIDGERCYQKFRAPEAIKIVVAGGTAGKFSAVIGSWVSGPRGSQMVTYPI